MVRHPDLAWAPEPGHVHERQYEAFAGMEPAARLPKIVPFRRLSGSVERTGFWMKFRCGEIVALYRQKSRVTAGRAP